MRKHRHILFVIVLLGASIVLRAQPSKLILHQEEGSITFAVDDVAPPDGIWRWTSSGGDVAKRLNPRNRLDWDSDWEMTVIANSFANEELHEIGEDVVFQMLMKAWSQHWPVVLSPDVIWMLICQQFSYYVNKHPEKMRRKLVNHKGKKDLAVESQYDLFSDQTEWNKLIGDFVSKIDTYTNNSLATTMVADFTTTGPNELIASQATLMNAVKPYFEYYAIYAICGIPSITLTGTPEDWRKVLEKTRSLTKFGFGWWVYDLDPILQEFVRASEGKPDYWFWKDIVKKTRPATIVGPSCGKKQKPQTTYDGWFLKFFPFDNKGRTPSQVKITQTMLAETVAVPFTYLIVNEAGEVQSETPLELIAGIVGVQQDTVTYTLTPKIGWFVRTVEPGTVSPKRYNIDSLLHQIR